jgi:hypothetical protein
MKERKSWGKTAGLVLHFLIAGLLVLTGMQKLLGSVPPAALVKYGLGEQTQLIGAGALFTALLLVVPRTSPLGILLISAFWGGAICIHMAHGEPYHLQAVLLVLSWVGAYLRNPTTFSSLSAPPGKDAGAGRSVRADCAVTGRGVERRQGRWHFEHGTGI